MKKIISGFLILCVLLGICVYAIQNTEPQKMLSVYEKVIEACGRTQITDDKRLIGERNLGEDAYIGTYNASCNNANGRDVIFGGGSLNERKIMLHGNIQTESGKATISVRMSDSKETVPTDDNGNFSILLELNGGGNYIMIDYENFKGGVKLYSDYEEILLKQL